MTPLPKPECRTHAFGDLWNQEQMLAYAAQCVAAERERWRAGLMQMHEAAKDRHNYYHCAVVAIEEQTP